MLDWDDVRFFLAVSRAGSLSAAAGELRVAQPTVGRRVTGLERRLGAKLFQRTPLGQELTPTGRRMLTIAERMENDAFALERCASGRDSGLHGKVRITASEWLIERVLAPLVAVAVAKYPDIELELIADPRHVSLVRREADIAIRPSRFEHQEVVQREIASIAFALYASDRYLAAHGAPDFADRGAAHALIAMSESLGKIPDGPWLSEFAGALRVVARANGRMPMVTLAEAGIGVVCLPQFLGDTAGLRLLSTPSPGPRRKLWLGYHRDARAIPRVRATATLLAESIARLRSALCPA